MELEIVLTPHQKAEILNDELAFTFLPASVKLGIKSNHGPIEDELSADLVAVGANNWFKLDSKRFNVYGFKIFQRLNYAIKKITHVF